MPQPENIAPDRDSEEDLPRTEEEANMLINWGLEAMLQLRQDNARHDQGQWVGGDEEEAADEQRQLREAGLGSRDMYPDISSEEQQVNANAQMRLAGLWTDRAEEARLQRDTALHAQQMKEWDERTAVADEQTRLRQETADAWKAEMDRWDNKAFLRDPHGKWQRISSSTSDRLRQAVPLQERPVVSPSPSPAADAEAEGEEEVFYEDTESSRPTE